MSAPRLRKAWAVRTRSMKLSEPSDTIYAPNAGKARAEMVSRLQDCGWEGNLWPEILVRRLPERDIVLPAEHRIATGLTPTQRDIVSHAYGGSRHSAGYRSHFVTHPSDMDLLDLAWVEGLFSGPHDFIGNRRPGLDGTPDMALFLLTSLGKEVAASMVPAYPHA